MGSFFRRIGYVLLISLIALGFLVLENPLLWSRYAGFLVGIFGVERQLTPTEIVEGSASFELPVADVADKTIVTDALADAEAYASQFDSYALVVVHKGVIQTEWYAEGFDKDTLTQSQSMHKSFLAMLVGAAISEALITSVDEPVSKYLPAWRDDPRGTITVKQMLEMSSGLSQYAFSLNPLSDEFQWLFGTDMVPIILKTPMADWSPGDRFDYNNINSEVLGLILQEATGKRYAEYLSEKIWQPIGAQDGRVWLDAREGQAHTSCCLYARPRDWAKVGMMLGNKGVINNRRVLRQSWIEQMITPSPRSDWYGYQIWLGYNDLPVPPNPDMPELAELRPFDSRDTFYLAGRGGQYIYVVPSQDLVIVRMGPSVGPLPIPPGYDVTYLVNTILRGVISPASPAGAIGSDEPLESETPDAPVESDDTGSEGDPAVPSAIPSQKPPPREL